MKLMWLFDGGRFVLYDFVSDQLSTLVERSFRETVDFEPSVTATETFKMIKT